MVALLSMCISVIITRILGSRESPAGRYMGFQRAGAVVVVVQYSTIFLKYRRLV